MTTIARTIRNLEDLPELVTRQELAAFTGISVQTLARWASERRGQGPKFIKLGGAVRYPKASVVAWVAEASAA